MSAVRPGGRLRYKQERKILLRNLTGSSAFKAIPQKEVAEDAASE